MTESQPISTPPSRASLRPVMFLIIVFGAWLAVVGVSKWWTPEERVPWQADFAAAQAQSRASQTPILLYFTASWCPPCQELRRSVWTDERVATAAQKYLPVKIDVDHNQALAAQFQVQSIPLLLVLDSAGKVERSLDFALGADEMIAWLSVTPSAR